MNYYVIIGITVVLIVLDRLRLPYLFWLLLWPVAAWAFIRFGITPPVPQSVVNIYLGLTIVALLTYLCTDNERLEEVKQQLTAFMVEKRFTLPLVLVVLGLPSALAAQIYFDMNKEVRAPTFGRTIHPAPPDAINFKGKQILLNTAKNPYRELQASDPTAFAAHVENGKRVYYQNCVFCHGDDMAGDGIFAHGFNPVPANFNSPTTIAMLQEAYLFWRIAKGGPGLPDESGPWSSSMPAWEKFLSEEEIWDVILFLYDYTGYEPRAEEEHH